MTPQEIDVQLIDAVLILGVLPLVFITSCVYLVLPKTKKKKNARLVAKITCGVTTILLLLVIYYGFIVPPGGI
jgi:uncharacterized BrkB/YihY/UPF0761 family membrane protein